MITPDQYQDCHSLYRQKRDSWTQPNVKLHNESEGVAQDTVVFFFNFGDYLKKIAPGTKR